MTLLKCLLIYSVIIFVESKIPDYIHVCRAKDPQISQCIIDSINSLKPRLKHGIPEIGVPGIEPLHLDTIRLRKGVQSNVTDLAVFGVADFKILELKANLPKKQFSFKLSIPRLEFKGNYEVDMKLLFLTVRGNGPIYGNLSNYYVEGLLQGNEILVNGKEHLKFQKMKLNVTLDKPYVRLENLFNGDLVLGELTNKIINNNVEMFLNEIKPTLENAISEKLTDISNQITLTFTYKELFL